MVFLAHTHCPPQKFPLELPYLQYFSYLRDLPSSDNGLLGQWYTVRPSEHVQLFSLNRYVCVYVALLQLASDLASVQLPFLLRMVLRGTHMYCCETDLPSFPLVLFFFFFFFLFFLTHCHTQ